ncbi:P-loop containing nucleoside triphosphate hydrolase protein [Earliella scabrosa]|nr:P-loop containing nucleoside triphosphate hydrolase protein [Earliella scabrosa]
MSAAALFALADPQSPRKSFKSSGYAKTTKELIQFVSALRALGAQVYLDLPRIVVIGNQSAGKSSLVEAISGINVPRDAGTCTRCPMECRLSNTSEAWSCQISIRWEYDGDGKRADEVSEVVFGDVLLNKDDVEPMLRRAQAAILNPTIPLSRFLDADIDTVRAGGVKVLGSKPLAFSRNVICVDLAGPELVDLSFVDLPGIVQNADQEVVQLVEDLVTSYVEGNCLILVTLPMSDDIENQKAARIAKHVDPEGLRTIGVMTKPDTLLPGATKSREMWSDVLEGRRHPLKHGYYCTRQPDDDRRLAGITRAEARAAEAEFFRTTAPWSSSSVPNRFGTANLVKNISELLTKIISDSLPNLLGEVASQLNACRKQLAALPPLVTTDPSAFVFNLVVSFCSDVLQHVEGSPTHTQLVQTNKATYETFKTSILSTAPAFVPFERDSGSSKESKRNVEYLKVDDESDKAVESSLKTKRVMYLGDVRQQIRSYVTRELPNNIPYAAKRGFIRDFQQPWEHHAMLCFDRVYASFKDALMEVIKERFDRFGNLRAVIAPAVMEQLHRHSQRATAHVKTILKLESAPPFTQNTHYFADKRDQQLAQYKRARPKANSSNFNFSSGATAGTVPEALAALARLGFTVKEEDLGKLNPPDEFQEELEVMAEVRAYFQVAYKRVIDYVPLSIDSYFLYAFAEGLQEVLFAKLELGAPSADKKCAAYIAEEPGIVALRSEVFTKKRRLESVQNALFNFGL